MKFQKTKQECQGCKESFKISGRMVVTRIPIGYKGKAAVLYQAMCPKCHYLTEIPVRELPLRVRWKFRKIR